MLCSLFKLSTQMKYYKFFPNVIFGSIALCGGGYAIHSLFNRRYGYLINQSNPQWHTFHDSVPVQFYFDRYIKNDEELSSFFGSEIQIIPNSCNVTIDGNEIYEWYGWFDCDHPYIGEHFYGPFEQTIQKVTEPDCESEMVVCKMLCTFKVESVTIWNDSATVTIWNDYAKYPNDSYNVWRIEVESDSDGQCVWSKSPHYDPSYCGRVKRFDETSIYHAYAQKSKINYAQKSKRNRDQRKKKKKKKVVAYHCNNVL
eukprot:469115_1